ncbi:hypothetical protein [Mycobacterium xenopi]|nr:hypothetical protein [Mycobacterium xenopi]EUA23162.1 integrase, catalytic region domain protein [Mycobacterium xenopi 4042]MDA3642310.1 hypothetical protein [Mycobacterium xenopi]MDA3660372.1 hypothetical protein [Mycobacterium xenopi]MDA3664965.1 hypothetical protein [Mycobacterium xenopi]ORX22160.1 hypothetical protein AWC32_19800 [Mycobacterium xenopi]
MVMCVAVLATALAREVAEAFIAAMRRYIAPTEAFSDNAGQFTGLNIKPPPVKFLVEKVRRDNGVKQRLTKLRLPTTTSEIERFHQTLRSQFLDHAVPFESIGFALDAWVHALTIAAHTRSLTWLPR